MTVSLIGLISAVAVISVSLAFMVRRSANAFIGHLAARYPETWTKLGRPRHDSVLSSVADVIVLPYLYRRRFMKFNDPYLTKLGVRLRKLYFAYLGVIVASLGVFLTFPFRGI